MQLLSPQQLSDQVFEMLCNKQVVHGLVNLRGQDVPDVYRHLHGKIVRLISCCEEVHHGWFRIGDEDGNMVYDYVFPTSVLSSLELPQKKRLSL